MTKHQYPRGNTPLRSRLKIRLILLILTLLLAFSSQSCGETTATSLFVASDGKDTNPGTLSAPFATLENARDAIRRMKEAGRLPEGGTTVYLREGTYRRAKTFELSEKDSGTLQSPIAYRNYENEKVTFSGGVPLKAADFKVLDDPAILKRLPQEARGKVMIADLQRLGLRDYGKLRQHGFSLPIHPAPLELFFDGEPMKLARWPNEGRVRIGKVLDRGSNPREGDFSNRGGRFKFDYDRAERWLQADDVWLHGIFSYGYADDNLKIAEIDVRKKEIRLALPHIYSLMSSDEETGGKHLRGYYAYNLLEEIDSPGEYFVDRSAGLLYFYPPSRIDDHEIVVSVFEEPMIALENVSNVVLEGFTFEYGRGMAIYLEQGDHSRISNCTFRNLGTVAICMGRGVDGPEGPVHEFEGTPVPRKIGNLSAYAYQNNAWNRMAGSNHIVENCHIYNTGTGGIILDGGDRQSLTSGNNTVRNCQIHDFNRWNKTYCPGIALKGVGNKVIHNYIHDAPHQAISLAGNDHLIEYNRIEKVCQQADDMGAIYGGRNPSERGTVIRHNFFLNFESDDSRIAAIYFDDGAGGGRVYGNVFYKVGHPRFGGIFVHGGHDHIFENNIFVKCKRVFGNSPWTDERWMEYLTGDLWLRRLTKEVDITKPPYAAKYPELQGFFEPAGKPRVNKGVGNVVYRCETFSVPQYQLERNLVTKEDPGFVDVQNLNFQLKDDSVVFQKVPGFQKIPFENIGLLSRED